MKQFKKIFGLLVVCVTMLSMVFMVQAAIDENTVTIYNVNVGDTIEAGKIITFTGGYNSTKVLINNVEVKLTLVEYVSTGSKYSFTIPTKCIVTRKDQDTHNTENVVISLGCQFLEPVKDDSDNEPSQAERTYEEVKAELTRELKALKDNEAEIKTITGAGASAVANTNAAEKLESLFRREKIGFTTIELEKGKVLVPVVDIKLLKMDGKFSYVLNDMAVGSDVYLQFKGTDEKLYSVPCTKLTPSAINRVYFTESYLTELAVK